MRATFSPEQEALAETAADLAATGREAARALLDGGTLPAEPTASLFGGFGGLAVPEASGGDGGDLVDLAIVVERLGRRVTPTPWVTHALAVQLALGALPVAELAPTLAGVRDQRWAPAVNEGRTTAVPHGAEADVIVATLADGRVALVRPAATTSRAAADRSRPLADVDVSGEPLVAGGDAEAGLRRATAVLAAELAGVGHGAVELAVDYANQREQFGQPIGRFQGIAHQLADAFTGIQSAWSLALYACWAVDADAADAVRSVHAAKARASDAAVFAAERATQTHGGIGITWEADPHLYLRRALTDAVWLGTAAWHRQRLAAQVLGA